MQRKVLGKGLSALMPEKPAIAKSKIVNLKISEIQLNKNQPRQKIDQPKLNELMSSIKEKGVIQPLLVRLRHGKYELIAGERRFRAAESLGFTELPAIVKDANDNEALELSLIENIQREELNPLEEAQAFQRLSTVFGFTQEKIARVVGKDASTVSNTLRLLKLPSEIQESLRKGIISMGHARTILALKSFAEQDTIFKRIILNRLSVRELEQVVSTSISKKAKHKKFIRLDPHLLALEEQIRNILGTKIKIISGRKRGKIVLEYYSLKDLDRIIELFKKIK